MRTGHQKALSGQMVESTVGGGTRAIQTQPTVRGTRILKAATRTVGSYTKL